MISIAFAASDISDGHVDQHSLANFKYIDVNMQNWLHVSVVTY